MPITPGLVVDIASGVLFIGLGAFVHHLGSGGKANRAFTWFAVVLGIFAIEANLVHLLVPDHPTLGLVTFLVSIPLAVAAVALMVRLARYIPRPTLGDDRDRVRWVPALVAGASILPVLVGLWGPVTQRVLAEAGVVAASPGAGSAPLSQILTPAANGLFNFVSAGALYLAAWMPIRYVQAEDDRDRHQAALLGVALTVWPMIIPTVGFGDPGSLLGLFAATGGTVLVGSMTVLWLAAASRGSPRPAREALWIILGTALAAAVAAAIWGATAVLAGGALGLARIAAVLVIAYGILRHQLLDLDLTVKHGIRRSTIAAVFIAVFFVVSEGAQVVFAGFVGSQILGIVAAGALVFALAPLQRFAASVADAAMPHVREPGEMTDDERLAMYRRQARVAWADGALSADERAMLDDLRDQLGLGAEVASEVESGVARDAGPDG